MLSEDKTMEMLEFYDLTGSYRSAAALAGVDNHTVRARVAARAAGLDPGARMERAKATDPFSEKILEWIDRSQGRIRADRVHAKLETMGYHGSERTTRRVVAALKAEWRRENTRAYKPWVPEPGLWCQWDYGDGPVVAGVASVLFCAWLAWSRHRVVLALRDKTLPSVVSGLDQTFRRWGGVPTYALTDNEKTVTEKHVARVAVRNPKMVSAAVYYGVSIATCVPYDPESKGGAEATVRIAKADLVPTDANLRGGYGSWDELQEACDAFCEKVNGRPHAITRRVPAEALKSERELLHAIPAEPYTVAHGESRAVSWSQTVSFRGARYSVPARWRNLRVWVRVAGADVVIVGDDPAGTGLAEIARHRLVDPGDASILDAHYPDHPSGPLERQPKATNRSEAAFLAIGAGAGAWLIEAAAVGARQIETRMAEAVALAQIHPSGAVDEALGAAAIAGRFAAGDLESILSSPRSVVIRPTGEHTMQPGTSAWEGFGR
ncbi:MAG: IS21 family transposase [Acidimicrobiia bacterium]|nr:IS21 family transposase [Acidimicrobiia bacterium]